MSFERANCLNYFNFQVIQWVIFWVDLLGTWLWRLVGKSGFYICGSLAILGAVGCAYFVYDSPTDHPCISQQEVEYILSNILPIEEGVKSMVPIKAMLSTAKTWVFFITIYCDTSFFNFVAVFVPLYLDKVLGLSLTMVNMLHLSTLELLWKGVKMYSSSVWMQRANDELHSASCCSLNI